MTEDQLEICISLLISLCGFHRDRLLSSLHCISLISNRCSLLSNINKSIAANMDFYFKQYLFSNNRIIGNLFAKFVIIYIRFALLEILSPLP